MSQTTGKKRNRALCLYTAHYSSPQNFRGIVQSQKRYQRQLFSVPSAKVDEFSDGDTLDITVKITLSEGRLPLSKRAGRFIADIHLTLGHPVNHGPVSAMVTDMRDRDCRPPPEGDAGPPLINDRTCLGREIVHVKLLVRVISEFLSCCKPEKSKSVFLSPPYCPVKNTQKYFKNCNILKVEVISEKENHSLIAHLLTILQP